MTCKSPNTLITEIVNVPNNTNANHQYNCNLIMPSLQSSEVHIEAGQPLRAISRLKEVGFQFGETYEPEEAETPRWRDLKLNLRRGPGAA